MEEIPRYKKNLDFPFSNLFSIYTSKYSEFNQNNTEAGPDKILG